MRELFLINVFKNNWVWNRNLFDIFFLLKKRLSSDIINVFYWKKCKSYINIDLYSFDVILCVLDCLMYI